MNLDIRYDSHDSFSKLQGAESFARMDAKAQQQARLDSNAKFFMTKDSTMSEARAYHLAKDLEFEYGEVLAEMYEPKSALRLFSQDTRPRPGAKTHSVKFKTHGGQARYFRANANDQGGVSVGIRKQEFPIHPIVTSIEFNYFDLLSDSFAGTSLRDDLEDAAREVMNDFLNQKVWYGDEDMGVYGVLNYPWLPKLASSIVIQDATSADSILLWLHGIANYAAQASNETAAPNRMVMSTRMRDYLGTRKRTTTSDETILEAFLRNNSYISSIDTAPEIQGAGAGGTDIVLLDRAGDRTSVANVVPQGFTMLPIQQIGYDYKIPVFAMHGGVIMRRPLNNLKVEVAFNGTTIA